MRSKRSATAGCSSPTQPTGVPSMRDAGRAPGAQRLVLTGLEGQARHGKRLDQLLDDTLHVEEVHRLAVRRLPALGRPGARQQHGHPPRFVRQRLAWLGQVHVADFEHRQAIGVAAVGRRRLEEAGEQRAPHHDAIDHDRVGEPYVGDVGAVAGRIAQPRLAFRRRQAVGHDLLEAEADEHVAHAFFEIEIAVRVRRRHHLGQQRLGNALVAVHAGHLFEDVRPADHAGADVEAVVGCGGADDGVRIGVIAGHLALELQRPQDADNVVERDAHAELPRDLRRRDVDHDGLGRPG